tara:strand:+ start:502 stop:912 length:411 start_codon:yes stop_codon:yes gene_type:complete
MKQILKYVFVGVAFLFAVLIMAGDAWSWYYNLNKKEYVFSCTGKIEETGKIEIRPFTYTFTFGTIYIITAADWRYWPKDSATNIHIADGFVGAIKYGNYTRAVKFDRITNTIEMLVRSKDGYSETFDGKCQSATRS